MAKFITDSGLNAALELGFAKKAGNISSKIMYLWQKKTANPRLLLLGAAMLCSASGWGQDIQLTTNEIRDLQELAKYNSRWNTFLNIWAFLGPLLSVILTWLGLRKKVEDWAEKEITKKANEKFGIDWAVVKQLVDEKRRDVAIKAKRLAIVNKETGRRQDLVSTLEKSGFGSPPPQFFNLNNDFNDKFNDNNFDLVVLDNHDGKLTEEEMRKIIEKHQFPYVLFTNTDLSPKFFNDFTGKVKFTKIQENIPDYVAQSF